ncbi:DUF3531 family protein [Synechococcus sp. RSCCF101]|uniref:DUF3531 family protein n=1 Tax=Synechococcus sp. RSCCF101 TaxID=2511069 RepID=UPI001246F1B7|nr:DUF3531 family protein [Synechococcus sp. RSCCF101]QEY31841.1 DUF3531 family protein [Synechococcus sp. RSCCF101]
MDIHFREVDPFNCWLWLRFLSSPQGGERAYVNGVLDSWFVLGKLGGFNAGNQQVQEVADSLSWMAYNHDQADQALPALMHSMSEPEYRGEWMRVWVDFGTSDAVALDVLINALRQLDADVVQLQTLLVGGENEDWPVEEPADLTFSAGPDPDA